MIRTYTFVALAAALTLGHPTAATANDEDAVRDAIRAFADRFNTKDNASLVGDVDYEYVYLPANTKGAFAAERLAGLIAAPAAPDSAKDERGQGRGLNRSALRPQDVRTLEEAIQVLPQTVKDTLLSNPDDPDQVRADLEAFGFRFDPPAEPPEPVREPDLLGADVRKLNGRNKGGRIPADTVLSLRPPPSGNGYRRDATTAAQEYGMAERRLLRWDLHHLYEAIPAEVILKLYLTEVVVQGDNATVQIDYGFGLDVETDQGQAFKAKSGALALQLNKVDGKWRVGGVKNFVDHMRIAVLE